MDGGFELPGSPQPPCVAFSLRCFSAMADVWSLTEEERVIALGAPDAAAYKRWLDSAIVEEPLLLPMKTVERLSVLMLMYSMGGVDGGPYLRNFLAGDWDRTVTAFMNDARKHMPELRTGR